MHSKLIHLVNIIKIIICSLTIKVPTFTEHESFLLVVVEDEMEHTEEEGQSPQEQPREISPHE